MTLALTVFDVLLCATLIAAAWRLLSADDLFKAVVLFIVFGLLMGLAWSRLDAPDVALAEVAIGAGLTGAMLLSTLGAVSSDQRSTTGAAPREDRR